MLSADEVQALRDASIRIIDPINEYIIKDICERLSVAGKFTSTAEYLAFRAEVLGVRWKDLKKEVAKRLDVSAGEVDRLYKEAAFRSYYNETKILGVSHLPFERNRQVQKMVQAAITLAEDDLLNITQTIGMVDPTGREMPLREFYASTMDFVFNNVSYGAMDYNTAVRIASTKLAEKGLTAIQYKSGVTTSLEAAVRRNIMGGIGLMVEQISKSNHKTFGANGWEMSAHGMSAPDHEPYQGRQYTDAEWLKLNGTAERPGRLKRRIGTLNCGHNAFPIIIGVNLPQYTPEQLQAMKDANSMGVTVNGKHYTMYEATQHQRGLERRIRTLKRQALAAKSTPDKERAAILAEKLRKKRREYKNFSKAAGLRTQDSRLYVANAA